MVGWKYYEKPPLGDEKFPKLHWVATHKDFFGYSNVSVNIHCPVCKLKLNTSPTQKDETFFNGCGRDMMVLNYDGRGNQNSTLWTKEHSCGTLLGLFYHDHQYR